MNRHNKGGDVNNIRETKDYYNQCIDDDLDFDDSIWVAAINESASKVDRDGARRNTAFMVSIKQWGWRPTS